MVGAIPGAFDERPEPLDGIGVDSAVEGIDVAVAVVDNDVRHQPARVAVGAVIVGHKSGLGRVNRLLDKSQQRAALCIVGHLGFDFPAALVACVFVSGLAAHIGFVHLDNSLEHFSFVRGHGRSDTLLHPPGRGRVQVEVPAQLVAGQALLGVGHQGDSQEPLLHLDMGPLENGLGEHVEAVGAFVAVPTAQTVLFVLPPRSLTFAERTPGLHRPPDLL